MKKIILLLVFMFYFTQVNADYCGMDGYGPNYIRYAFYIGNDEYKIVDIFVPKNIEYIEYLYMIGDLSPSSYEYKLVKLNDLLVKKGLDSIY